MRHAPLVAAAIVTLVTAARAPLAHLDHVRAKPMRVTDRKADTGGRVLVLMYHKFGSNDSRYTRSYSSFKKDLENLYNAGFRPVTVKEYVENKMKLAPGASPVILTFDDAHPSQFKLNKDGSISNASAVGIWSKFAADHPDFPVHGVFYVVTSMMWAQHKLVDKKLHMLSEMGSEIGNHTVHHPLLSKVSSDKAAYEVAGGLDYLSKKGYTHDLSFALPYGAFPHNHSLVKMFKWNGKVYQQESVMLAGDCLAFSPTSKAFNRYRIPRIIANDKDKDSLGYWWDRIQVGKVRLYVAP